MSSRPPLPSPCRAPGWWRRRAVLRSFPGRPTRPTTGSIRHRAILLLAVGLDGDHSAARRPLDPRVLAELRLHLAHSALQCSWACFSIEARLPSPLNIALILVRSASRRRSRLDLDSTRFLRRPPWPAAPTDRSPLRAAVRRGLVRLFRFRRRWFRPSIVQSKLDSTGLPGDWLRQHSSTCRSVRPFTELFTEIIARGKRNDQLIWPGNCYRRPLRMLSSISVNVRKNLRPNCLASLPARMAIVGSFDRAIRRRGCVMQEVFAQPLSDCLFSAGAVLGRGSWSDDARWQAVAPPRLDSWFAGPRLPSSSSRLKSDRPSEAFEVFQQRDPHEASSGERPPEVHCAASASSVSARICIAATIVCSPHARPAAASCGAAVAATTLSSARHPHRRPAPSGRASSSAADR